MIWHTDTCYCVIECTAPSVNGKYIARCTVHRNSKDTTECYNYNLFHRKLNTESEKISEERKRLNRATTKP